MLTCSRGITRQQVIAARPLTCVGEAPSGVGETRFCIHEAPRGPQRE